MTRIAVYDPHGQAGTIEDGDTTGATFLPERSFLNKASSILSSKMLTPMISAAETGTSLIPEGALTPALTAGGVGLGLFAPLPGGATAGGSAGGALGSTLKNIRQAKRTGQSTLPSSAESDVIASTLGGGSIGGTADLVKAGIGLGKGAATLFSKRRQVALAQKARGALGEVMKGAGPAMEQELKNLPGTVDLSRIITPLQEAINNPEIGAALQEKVFQGIQTAAKVGDTTLRDVLSNPELAKSLNPLQAQQIMNTLRQAGSTARAIEQSRTGAFIGKGGKFLQQVSGEDLQLLQHANEVKQVLTGTYPEAFPQIGGKFGQTVSAGRFLTPKFKEGNLVGNILSGFKDPEVAAKVREMLPANITKELFAPSRVAKIGKVAGAVAGGGAIIGGLKSLLRR